MSKEVVRTNRFKKDLKRLQRQGKDMAKLRTVLNYIIDGEALPLKYKDHPLRGEWFGSRDCHVEPDWVLIYTEREDEVCLERMGSHSDLFK